MEYIDIEYNQDLSHLDALLSEVEHPGDFYAAGTLELPMPRIEVHGAGVLSFPIPRAQTDALIQQATQAPYGRGEETIVDTSVRNVWQIAPDTVKIGGKSWAASFERIFSEAITALGCHGAPVRAELYKMLIYDRGGFFLPHRDTEKADGMFGTLVVTLPSEHRGGALRIRHGNSQVTVATDGAEHTEIQYAAFYADCEHEVLPVVDGRRVCLIFNLIHERAAGKRRELRPPGYRGHADRAAAILSEYWRSPSAASKIVWILEHQYSPTGLSFGSLKGADAARGRVLVEAAELAQCSIHLGIVHIGESGGAEPDYDDSYFRSRRNRYGGFNGEEEDDEDEDADFTAITIDDAWKYVDEWRNAAGDTPEFGRIPVEENELLPAGALEGEPPDEKRLTEASGNEGATFERSYHRAAAVIWPAERMIDVLLAAGVAATLPYLQGLEPGQAAIATATRVVEAWPVQDQRGNVYSLDFTAAGPAERATLLEVLIKLEAPWLIERFIRESMAATYSGPENDSLLKAARLLGDDRTAEIYSELFGKWLGYNPGACIALLDGLTLDRARAFRKIATAVVEGLDHITPPDPRPAYPSRWQSDSWDSRRRPIDDSSITALLEVLGRFEDPALCEAAAAKLAARPSAFDPVKLLLPVIERAGARIHGSPSVLTGAVERLWRSTAEYLLNRSEVRPEPPPDWRLEAKLSCTCADCRELQRFVDDPVERVHRFRVKQERRDHLSLVMSRHELEISEYTERKGSPQTLVCTKDRRSFKTRMAEYEDEIDAMQKLLRSASLSSAVLAARMDAAIKASAL